MPSAEQYAEMRKRSLMRNRPDLYRAMMKSKELEPHLKEIGESAAAMEDNLLAQMQEKKPLPKEYLERVKAIGQNYRVVSEIVMHELIHEPDLETAKAMAQGGYD